MGGGVTEGQGRDPLEEMGEDLAHLAMIESFRAAEHRKQHLFEWAKWFLLMACVAFFALLICAFILVARNPGAWHLFLAPAIVGVLGMVVGVATIRAVFHVKASSVGDFHPLAGTASDFMRDLSEP